MKSIRLQIPESLLRKAKEMSRKDNVSINQFITSALAEKLSALMTEDYLEARARRGDRAKFDAALDAVPDAEPDERDKL